MRWRPVVLAVLALTALLAATAQAAKVAAPRFMRTIPTGETGWFSSPGLVDLNGDGRLEIVAPSYSTFVFDAGGHMLAKGTATKGRVYAPGVVADLDGDKVPEIVVGGNEGTVAAYDLIGGNLQLKPGWPASTCSGGQCPEARGMAAADLDGDGKTEVVVTTTNTSPTGSQVFVFNASGGSFRPAGAPANAWPRYNGLDATFNGIGNHGYGAYGENVGIGNLDDDPQLEIVVTFDNHQINVFNDDGTSVLASPWFTNRESGHVGARLG
jgi:FG-GAP-like repeat